MVFHCSLQDLFLSYVDQSHAQFRYILIRDLLVQRLYYYKENANSLSNFIALYIFHAWQLYTSTPCTLQCFLHIRRSCFGLSLFFLFFLRRWGFNATLLNRCTEFCKSLYVFRTYPVCKQRFHILSLKECQPFRP